MHKDKYLINNLPCILIAKDIFRIFFVLLDAYPCEWNLELIEFIMDKAEK